MERENDINYNWYALKVFFNKVFDVESSLSKDNIESYIPCEKIAVMKDGKKSFVRRPVISSLVFFRTTERQALGVQEKLVNRVILYTRLVDYRKIPVVIPEREMEVFMLVTSSGERGLEYFGDDRADFHLGERVRVTDGPFKGAEGYIKRIKGNRRLIVSIKGICAVATSYIPQCFLQKIQD